jgi:hypothetical protein
MAKDVAQLELDQSGLRISNLGTPTTAGDATKTDNTTVPLANAGAGAPGTSFLAAPIDHVHPASPGGGEGGSVFNVSLSDPSEQSMAGPDETVIAEFPVDFSGAPGSIVPVFGAVVDVDAGMATFRLRVGADPGIVTGPVLATITTSSAAFELKSVTAPSFLQPGGVSLIKITAASDDPAHTCRIRSKSVVSPRRSPS